MAGWDTFVVVGGGLAAAWAIDELRGQGFDGRIVLVGAEQHLPYERPPLSKGYLLGEQDLQTAFVQSAEWYDDHEIDLELGTPATAIDLTDRTVMVGDHWIAFHRLLVATGAAPRLLPAVDDSGAPVTYLRTIEDSHRIERAIDAGDPIVVIGGGWIGLEVAAAARTRGCDVVVVETQETPLSRVLGPEVGEVFAELHRSHGVDLRTNAALSAVEDHACRAVVRLADGSAVEAGLVLVGVGVSPNVALAEAAGLETGNGIVVDEHLQTSHPDVFAAGDVANTYHPRLARRLRVEHWDNAIEQGRTAGRNMLGAGESYDRLPYFYTDQYDLGMEYVGNVGPDGYDEMIVRGDVPNRVFTSFRVKDGAVVAGMHANDWDAIESVRSLVGADSARLRDPAVPLDQLAG
jgi:3-phenylpropionate/trans-cinnamate dioxygenase ferredoxin reductase subunit